MSTRKIRVSVELNIAGHNIPDEYGELPEGWDDWSEQERDDFLTMMAMEALSCHAGSGASVVEVDDNGKEIEQAEVTP
jgi:hypothetical protein